MNRLFPALLGATLVLAACGGANDDDDASDAPAAVPATAAPAPAPAPPAAAPAAPSGPGQPQVNPPPTPPSADTRRARADCLARAQRAPEGEREVLLSTCPRG